MKKNKAFFLDRDGIIIKNIPYLRKVDQIEFLPDVQKAIRKINKNNYICIIITNQSGIARGLVSIEELNDIHNNIMEKIKKGRGKIDAIYFCPHHPNAKIKKFSMTCMCRKPKPGLILEAEKIHNLELKDCYLVGDQDIDFEAGSKANCKSFIIKKSMMINNKEIIFNNLKEVVDFILANKPDINRIKYIHNT